MRRDHDLDIDDPDDGPDNDPRAGWEQLLATLTPAARAAMLAPEPPPEPIETEPVVVRLDQILARMATGTTPAKTGSKKVSAAEANIRVADYLAKHAKANPRAVTIRDVAELTKVPKSSVGKTPAWR